MVENNIGRAIGLAAQDYVRKCESTKAEEEPTVSFGFGDTLWTYDELRDAFGEKIAKERFGR